MMQPRYRQEFLERVESRPGQRQVGPELHVPGGAVPFVEPIDLVEEIPAKERRCLDEHAGVMRETVKIPAIADERRPDLSRRVCEVAMARDDVSRGPSTKLARDFHQAAGQQEVVSVEKSENLAGGETKSLVERVRRSPVAFRDTSGQMR